MRTQTMKEEGERVPCNNAGRQSDPNVRRTLVHVGPTMGGIVTLPPLQVEHPHSTIHGWTRVLWTVLALWSLILLTASASARRHMEACKVRLMSTI